jgi:hypothetical protein
MTDEPACKHHGDRFMYDGTGEDGAIVQCVMCLRDERDRLLLQNDEARKLIAQLSSSLNHLVDETGPKRRVAKGDIDAARDYLTKYEKRNDAITIGAPPVCGKCYRLNHKDVECRVRS